MKRNLTIQLDESVISKARVVAARRATSISRLVSEEIERAAEKDTAWQATQKAALAQLDKGFHLGGQPLAKRDTLYKR